MGVEFVVRCVQVLFCVVWKQLKVQKRFVGQPATLLSLYFQAHCETTTFYEDGGVKQLYNSVVLTIVVIYKSQFVQFMYICICIVLIFIVIVTYNI